MAAAASAGMEPRLGQDGPDAQGPVAHALTYVAQRSSGTPSVQRDDADPAVDRSDAEATDVGPSAANDAEEMGGGKKKAKATTRLTMAQVEDLINQNNNSSQSTALLLCLIWTESTFDPTLKNSGSSATGLMQLTKAAVADVNKNTPKGVHFEHSEMTGPARNIECGTYYLQMRIDRAGSTRTGLAGYGTGDKYADNILNCEACWPAATDKQTCLDAIHR